MPAQCLVYSLIGWHTLHPHLGFFLQVTKGMEEQCGYNTVGSKHCIRGHSKPTNQAYACHPSTLWVELHFDSLFGWGLIL